MSTALSLTHGHELGPAQAPTMRLVEDLARELVEEARPHNTRVAYQQDMGKWRTFCGELGLAVDTVSESLLGVFAHWLIRCGAAPSVVERRIAGVVSTLRDLLGVTRVPRGITRSATLITERYRRQLDEAGVVLGRGETPLVTPAQVRAMCMVQPDTPIGLRNRTMMSWGIHIGPRVGEVRRLRVHDIADLNEGLKIHVGYSKGHKPRDSVINRDGGNDLCGLALWRQWRHRGELVRPDQFVFTGRGSDTPLTAKAINKMLAVSAQRAQLGVHLTWHSMRAGFATEAYRNGATILEIAEQGGWAPNSPQLWLYIRLVDQWENASRHIRL